MAEPQAQPKQYVRTDEHGVMRVGASFILFDLVVGLFERGESPESIRSNFPTLTLEEIYGAITYYLAHREEVAAYLKRQQEIGNQWEAWARAQPSPVRDRLRALMAEAASRK